MNYDSSSSASTSTTMWWQITDHQYHNNATGYWSNSITDTATHSFCEPHYVVTQYIAEFYNSLSSLFPVLVGMYIIYKFWNYDKYTVMAGIWMSIVGIGSLLFHGTMKYYMQLLDELPMIGFVMTTMLAKADITTQVHTFIGTYSVPIQTLIIFECFSVATLYLYFDMMYEIFIHGFSLIVVTDEILSLAHVCKKVAAASPSSSSSDTKTNNNISQQRLLLHCMLKALGFITIGRIIWESENRLCIHYPNVWPLHIVWHIFSTISAYYSAIGSYLCRITPVAVVVVDNSEAEQQQQYRGLPNNLIGVRQTYHQQKKVKLT